MKSRLFLQQPLVVAINLIIFVPLIVTSFIKYQLGKSPIYSNLAFNDGNYVYHGESGLLKLLGDDLNQRDAAITRMLSESHLESVVKINDPEFTAALYGDGGEMKRFLQDTKADKKQPHGSSGTGAIFWLAGSLQFDYPFACKCEPGALETFSANATGVLTPVYSTIQCASAGPSASLFGSNVAYCDPTNSTTGLSLTTAFLIPIIGCIFFFATCGI